ncbi:MAG: hypothetical protein EKK31_09300 [Hyphomicrobiales bacterium]|uniref:Uncharacterized protein n=1 Tax=Methylocystis echinoides TaxID=29468 RepID=A0A9W6GZJ1_9HYPH|nr:hypothetical protein [Methylocystis echinoides]RTM08477.1 MAG: hypothetical protein EKK31_09300 [Hyphomicrobiales bacterium]GLI95966.1 hypothetical protein LMG27198_49580 [Methylocystis echinoides]
MTTVDDEEILETRRVREVAGVFHKSDVLEDTIESLLLAGFDRSDVDIMGEVEAVRRRLGQLYIPPEELADVPGTPRRAFVARDDLALATAGVAGILFYVGAAATVMSIVASGGSLAVIAAAAMAAGTVGAGVGAAAVRLLGKRQAEELDLQLMSGGIVLWVRVRTAEKEAEAQEILAKFGAEAIRVHEIDIAKRLEDVPLANVHPDPWLEKDVRS